MVSNFPSDYEKAETVSVLLTTNAQHVLSIQEELNILGQRTRLELESSTVRIRGDHESTCLNQAS